LTLELTILEVFTCGHYGPPSLNYEKKNKETKPNTNDTTTTIMQ